MLFSYCLNLLLGNEQFSVLNIIGPMTRRPIFDSADWLLGTEVNKPVVGRTPSRKPWFAVVGIMALCFVLVARTAYSNRFVNNAEQASSQLHEGSQVPKHPRCSETSLVAKPRSVSSRKQLDRCNQYMAMSSLAEQLPIVPYRFRVSFEADRSFEEIVFDESHEDAFLAVATRH